MERAGMIVKTDNVLARMKKLNMTFTELAYKMGFCESHVRKLITNKGTLLRKHIEDFDRILGNTEEWFTNEE